MTPPSAKKLTRTIGCVRSYYYFRNISVIRRLRNSLLRVITRALVLSVGLALSSTSFGQTVLTIAAPESAKIYVPLIERVLKDARIDPKITLYPSERARRMFLAGEVDAEFFRLESVIDERYPTDTIKIGPLLIGYQRLFVRADDTARLHASTDDLLKQPLLYALGNGVAKILEKERHLTMEIAPNRESLFKMLVAGRTNVVLDNERIALKALDALGLRDKVQGVGEPIDRDLSFFLMRAAVGDMAPRVRDAFNRWLHTGQWQRAIAEINRAHGLPADLGIAGLPKQK